MVTWLQGNPGPGGQLGQVLIRNEGWNMGGMRACFQGRGYPEDQIYDRAVSNSGVVVGGAQAVSKYVSTLIQVGVDQQLAGILELLCFHHSMQAAEYEVSTGMLPGQPHHV
jgi:hypothetical protein